MATMKNKTFEFNTGGDFLIIAFARISGVRCYVNFVYSNSTDNVRYIDIDELDIKIIKMWAKKNECEEIHTPTLSENI